MIYLDNSATTIIDPKVLKKYNEVSSKNIGNPSSLHKLGRSAKVLLDDSRRKIADLLKVSQSEIFFTSGGTEGNNWIVKGVSFEKREQGNHIIVSSIEHSSVKHAAEWLTTQGFRVDYAPVDVTGCVIVSELEKLICEDTILVSIMAVNNEVGSIQPILEISNVLRCHTDVSFHVDAVQAFGKIPVEEFLTDRVDYVTLSAHKFNGPRGVGIIIARVGKLLTPLLHGGGQEMGRRSATENLAGIVATEEALRITLSNEKQKMIRIREMRQIIYTRLVKYDNVVFFSKIKSSAPNILTFGIKGVKGVDLVNELEKQDIYVSTTSACSSKKSSAPGTLVAMKIPADIGISAVRVSLDSTNNILEIEHFLAVFHKIFIELKNNSM